MKQNRMKKWMAPIMVLSAILMAGCSTVDNPVSDDFINIADGFNQNMTVGYHDSFLEIPIESNTEWQAAVVTSGANWLSLYKEIENNKKRLYVIISNNDEQSPREAEIEISSRTQNLRLKLTQLEYGSSLLVQGDDSGNQYFDQYNPLGYSLYIDNPTTGNDIAALTKKQIFKMNSLYDEEAWQKLKKGYGFTSQKDFLGSGNLTSTKIDMMTAQDFESARQNISANLQVTIGYGLFKFGLEGSFIWETNVKDTTFVSQVAASCPVYQYYIPNTLLTANTQTTNNSDLDNSDLENLVYTKEFNECRNGLFKAAKEFEAANKTIDECLQNVNIRKYLELLDEFGPIYVKTLKYGGTVSIQMSYSETYANKIMEIKGKMKAQFSSAFSIDVEANADYVDEGTNYTEMSKIDIGIDGGDGDGQDSVIDSMTDLIGTQDQKEAIRAMLKSIRSWKKTLKPDYWAVSDYQIGGVWELFVYSDDYSLQNKVQKIIKKYMRNKYPDTPIYDKEDKTKIIGYNCPYLVSIRSMTEGINED